MAIWNVALGAATPAAGFQERLLADALVRRYLSEKEIAQCFELEHNFRHLDAIFARLGLP